MNFLNRLWNFVRLLTMFNQAVEIVKILQETTIESYISDNKSSPQDFFGQLQNLAKKGKNLYLKYTGASGLTTFGISFGEILRWENLEDMVKSFHFGLNKIPDPAFTKSLEDIRLLIANQDWAIQVAVPSEINPETLENVKKELSLNFCGQEVVVGTEQNIENDIHCGNLLRISQDTVSQILKGTIHEGKEEEFVQSCLFDLYLQLKNHFLELTPITFKKILEATGPWGQDFILTTNEFGQKVLKRLETNFRITGTTYPLLALIKQYGMEKIAKMMIKGQEIITESQNFSLNPAQEDLYQKDNFAQKIGERLENTYYQGIKLSKLVNIFAIYNVEGSIKITAVISALNFPTLNNETEIPKIVKFFGEFLAGFETRILI